MNFPNTKILFIVLTFCFLILFLGSCDQFKKEPVHNVDFQVREDQTIEITYDFIPPENGNDKFAVSIAVSTDGGKTFSIKPKAVDGDVGEDIKPGAGKRIVWHVMEDLEQLTCESLVIEVTAETEKKIITKAGIEFIFVKGGTFEMGDQFGDGDDDEKPVHSVTVSDFHISKTEVTVGQFRKFMNATNYQTEAEKQGWAYIWTGSTWEKKDGASWKKPGFSQTENHPVVCVSWNDAKAFCNWVGCRLPTEAEWEYAARGGGKSRNYKYSGSNNLDDVGWYRKNSGKKAHQVGQKKPNELGLYDMSGNVREWCSDWYDSEYYKNSPRDNPQGANSGKYRVLRGGSWDNIVWSCRSSNRYWIYPDIRADLIGFRIIQGSPL